MKKNDGYILLNSLLTIAIILVCSAAFFFSLAMAERQNGHLGNRLKEEMLYRSEKILERLK